MVSKPINPFHWSFFASFRVSNSCVCVFFYWMETMFCKYECGYGPKDHREDPNHMRKFNCLAYFSIKRIYTQPDVVEIRCYHWIHTHANGDLAHSACDPGSMVHITNVSIWSTCVSQVDGVYMDPIRVRVHREANLSWTQRNLVGMGECGWVDDLGWFPTTPRYCLFRSEAQEGHLALAHKLDTFHWIMGLCSSWWCFFISRMQVGECDSCPFHHRDPNTYVSGHVPIQSQQVFFCGCHVWQ